MPLYRSHLKFPRVEIFFNSLEKEERIRLQEFLSTPEGRSAEERWTRREVAALNNWREEHGLAGDEGLNKRVLPQDERELKDLLLRLDSARAKALFAIHRKL